MEFTFVDNLENLTRIEVSGRLDLPNSGRLETELNRVSARRLPVVMDLSQVEFVASIALGLLVVCAQGLARWDCKMVLVQPSPLVEKVLRTSRVDLLIPIAADLEQARALLANA